MKSHLKKKGQLHISETIAVLFIFFVLVVFGLIFYFKYTQYALKEEQNQLSTARAIRTTSKVLFLPELACTRGSAEPEDDCIDVMKLRQLNATINRHLQEYYYNMFGYAKISVVKVYPKEPWAVQTEISNNSGNISFNLNVAALGEERWVVYDLPRPINLTKEAYSYSSTYFIVTLRDEAIGGEKIHYGFGYIEVGVYG